MLQFCGFFSAFSAVNSSEEFGRSFLLRRVNKYLSDYYFDAPSISLAFKNFVHMDWHNSNNTANIIYLSQQMRGRNLMHSLASSAAVSQTLFACENQQSYGLLKYNTTWFAFSNIQFNRTLYEIHPFNLTNTRTVSSSTVYFQSLSWYMETKAKQTMKWGDVYLTPSNSHAGMNVVYCITIFSEVVQFPLLDNANSFVGAGQVSFYISDLSSYLSRFSASSTDQTWRILITEPNGKLIAFSHGPSELLLDTGLRTRMNVWDISDTYSLGAVNKLKASGFFSTTYKKQADSIMFSMQYKFNLHLLDMLKLNIDTDLLSDASGLNRYVIVVSGNTEVMTQFLNAMFATLGICAALFILMILFALCFGAMVTRPLAKLSKEMELVSNLDLNSTTESLSSLYEFYEMQLSLNQMKQGLDNFKKFVPTDVVREMVKRDEGVHLGVTERMLTICFMEITNCLQLTEQMDPKVVVNIMEQFFTKAGEIIYATDGTIDKVCN